MLCLMYARSFLLLQRRRQCQHAMSLYNAFQKAARALTASRRSASLPLRARRGQRPASLQPPEAAAWRHSPLLACEVAVQAAPKAARAQKNRRRRRTSLPALAQAARGPSWRGCRSTLCRSVAALPPTGPRAALVPALAPPGGPDRAPATPVAAGGNPLARWAQPAARAAAARAR